MGSYLTVQLEQVPILVQQLFCGKNLAGPYSNAIPCIYYLLPRRGHTLPKVSVLKWEVYHETFQKGREELIQMENTFFGNDC